MWRGYRSLAGGLLACAALVTPHAALGQPGPSDLRVHSSRVTGLASFVTAADGKAIPLQLDRAVGETNVGVFLREHGNLFGITDPAGQLAVQKVEVDALGYTHTTFQQVHGGVKVFSGIVRVHQDPTGAVHAANGDFYPISAKLPLEPVVGADAAQQVAIDAVAHPRAGVESSELLVVDPGWYGDPARGARLAWHTIVAAPLEGVREAFFVDAVTGEVLDRWSMIHTARDREIYDGMETGSIPGTLARAEGDPATGDLDIDAAYDWYGDTYDYFFRAFGRDGIDGSGMTMIATVHSTAPSCPNAFWNGSQMVFCTGTVTDDIVGHELMHGVTDYTANLIYQNQSGQLNESFSDVFGELIDLFNGDAAFSGAPGGTPWPTHPTGPGADTPNNLRTACSPAPDYLDGVRWLIGEDAGAFGGAIRDMWDPPCRNDPDFANSTLQTCPAGDSGGVHSGSGIPNHAFAMLTDGKSFNGRVVAGIGPIKSGAVWYRALTTYLTPASDFADAYPAFNQAAQDLVGTFPNDPRTGAPSLDEFTAFDADQVDEALLAVEMNTDGACGQSTDVLVSDPPTICAGAAAVFSDDFESGAAGWTVSNTGPPTPYDWQLISTGVPFDRPGTVWFADDPQIGDCNLQDESAVHSLISPTYALPDEPGVYLLSFTHYLGTEGAWDGGNVKISVNGGPLQAVPRRAFEHNPYNGALRRDVGGNTNPLQGQTAWNGAGGQWGTSVINLAGIAAGGDSIVVQFDLGKDGCTGIDGWYVDDFEIRRCPDGNDDGVSDHRDVLYIDATDQVYGVGTGVTPMIVFSVPRRALTDVTLALTAYADLSSPTEYLDVEMEAVNVGRLFESGASDCAYSPNYTELTIPRSTFNDLLIDTMLDVSFVASANVNAGLCGGDNYITVSMRYDQAGPGDVDGSGAVDIEDLLDLLAKWGPCADCFEDLNGDGAVTIEDLLALLAAWG